MKRNLSMPRASGAYAGATYAALGIGSMGFLVGLWNATMQLNEKGYYFTLLAFGLFAAVSLQKCLRDQTEGMPVSGPYLGTCYAALGLSLLLLAVGLWNATLLLSEKGFYAMSFVLALYSAVTMQKNVRDAQALALMAEREAPAPAVRATVAED
jgi:uncharacterized membrane protein YiaA